METNSNAQIVNILDKTNSTKHDGYKYCFAVVFEEPFCLYDDEVEVGVRETPEYLVAQEAFEDWTLASLGFKRDEVFMDWMTEDEVWISTNNVAKPKASTDVSDDETDSDEEVTMSDEELGVKIYMIDGVKGVDKHGVMKLVGISHYQQIAQRVRNSQLTKLGTVPMAVDDLRELAIFDLEDVLSWAADFKPRDAEGNTRYQLTIADEDMAKVVKFLQESKIKYGIENLTKKSREAARKHHAKAKASKKSNK